MLKYGIQGLHSRGIAPSNLRYFHTSDRFIARSEGSLGIGLTLVQKLAEMHGATVTAHSEGSGKGSEFILRFPAAVGAAKAKAQLNTVLPRVARQSSRVLAVDDNVDTAGGLAKLLKLLGHDVRITYEGETAIEIAREHRPEVILLDIGLPGMDGYQVVRQLRQEQCCKTALIIAVSGYGQDEERRKSQQAGFDHHLVKPVDFDALMSLLA